MAKYVLELDDIRLSHVIGQLDATDLCPTDLGINWLACDEATDCNECWMEGLGSVKVEEK